jgi:excisionase family DNA binding protein
MEAQKFLYTISEAAAALGISPRAVEHLVRTQRLPRRKIGRRALVPADALRRFAAVDQGGLGIPWRPRAASATQEAK